MDTIIDEFNFGDKVEAILFECCEGGGGLLVL
jgi:hypothetical protein